MDTLLHDGHDNGGGGEDDVNYVQSGRGFGQTQTQTRVATVTTTIVTTNEVAAAV